jgi:Protein of unknown function (DUF3995)
MEMGTRKSSARNLTTLGLTAVGGIHLAWAAGSSWPTSDRGKLADLVVGVRPFPSTAMTLGVVSLIGAGITFVEMESRAVPPPGGRSATSAQRVRRLAATGVPAVLAVRGVGGLIVSTLNVRSVTPEFRTWDLILYSPFCIALAVGAAMAIKC